MPNRIWQYVKTYGVSATRGSGIRPIPELAVSVTLTRYEGEGKDGNTSTVTVLMTPLEAIAFAASVNHTAVGILVDRRDGLVPEPQP